MHAALHNPPHPPIGTAQFLWPELESSYLFVQAITPGCVLPLAYPQKRIHSGAVACSKSKARGWAEGWKGGLACDKVDDDVRARPHQQRQHQTLSRPACAQTWMDGSRSDRLSRVHARSTVLAPEINCGEFLEHHGHRTGAARGLSPRHGCADPSRGGGLGLIWRGDKRRKRLPGVRRGRKGGREEGEEKNT